MNLRQSVTSKQCGKVSHKQLPRDHGGTGQRGSLTYYITVPSYLIPGVNTSLAVHWFGEHYPEVNVTGEIVDKGKCLVTANSIFKKDSIGILTLPSLPEQASSVYFTLIVNGTSQKKLVFSKKIQIERQTKNTFVFIQTDKAVYKPGQNVKIRVVSVYHDLRPCKRHLDIFITDPQGNNIYQWLKLKGIQGVISTDLTLSNNPMFGNWFIKAITNDSDVELASFSVNEYVLLKFDFEITVPSFYVETKQADIVGTVTAKYTYGKPVTGTVTIFVVPLYNYEYSEAIKKTYQISGSVNFSFTHEEIKKKYTNWEMISVTVYLTEELSGSTINKTSYIEKITSEYKITIHNDKPLFIESDQTCKIQIQILRIDNAALSKDDRKKRTSVKVIHLIKKERPFHHTKAFLYNNWNTLPYCPNVFLKEFSIPESGLITVEFPVQMSTQIKVEAKYQNTTEQRMFDLPYKMIPFVEMKIPNSEIEVGREFIVQVNTYPNIQAIYYVVMAKGIIVACGVKMNTSFSMRPEHSWAPSAVLIVYFLNRNVSHSDIVKTSQNLHIKGAFKNTVSLLWNKSKAQRKNVSLAITVGESHSLLGLRIVDKSATNGNYLTSSTVENALVIQTEYKTASLRPEMIPHEGFKSALYKFSEDNKPVIERTFFPETWIWMEINISSGITSNLQFVVPDTITSWEASAFVISENLGLAVTEKSVELEVSQSFFISLNLPYSVTRSEQFILEVILINYLEENLEVTVTLEASDSFEVIVPNNDVSKVAGQKNVVVPSQDGKTVLFPIKPQKLGKIPITVKATSSAVFDAITQSILVKAEGVDHYYSLTEVFEVDGTSGAAQTVTKTFSFTFPSDTVQGSEEAVVMVIGDFLGPSINGLESLIQMPCGCGEQNMINFAPNIYVLQYLTATNQLKDNIRTKLIRLMEQGYQRELTFKRGEGSFSAFGESDSSGSTWLSAFVFRCFLQARPFIYISPAILDQTVQWLVQYQDMKTGIFSEPGRVIHTELQGGLNGPITLTAYILTSLLEDEAYRNRYASRVLKAVHYLESKFDDGISSNHTLSVVVYALSLANSTKANAALNLINSRANNIGGLRYWSSSKTSKDWPPQSLDTETAAYVLLSHYTQNRILDGIPIMKWLSQQRNHLGGYSSTQDTIMALQALSQFMVVAPSGATSLNLEVSDPGSFVPKTFQINNENLLILQSQQIPVSGPLSINVTAVGNGLAIVQLNIMYNQKASSRHKRNTVIPEAFTLDVAVNEDTNNIDRLSVHVCTSYQGAGNESGMALLDVGFLSGFTLDPVGIPINESLKLVEKKDDKVYLYYYSMTKTQVCVSVPMVRAARVAGSQDSVIRVSDYYNPKNTATRTYNSETMSTISTCYFCGSDCSLCISNVPVMPQTSNDSASTFGLFGLCLLLPFVVYSINQHGGFRRPANIHPPELKQKKGKGRGFAGLTARISGCC
ncbi:LOW QUALITY PROTEIN: CD109 antigen-like [Pelodytes ibericus]